MLCEQFYYKFMQHLFTIKTMQSYKNRLLRSARVTVGNIKYRREWLLWPCTV